MPFTPPLMAEVRGLRLVAKLLYNSVSDSVSGSVEQRADVLCSDSSAIRHLAVDELALCYAIYGIATYLKCTAVEYGRCIRTAICVAKTLTEVTVGINNLLMCIREDNCLYQLYNLGY